MTQTIERTGITLPPLPEIDDVTRREFLIGAAGLLTLPAGCGGGGEGGDGASRETRTVKHALGVAKVPVEPRRVVAMDPYASLQTALAVGSPVVGSPTFANDPFPDFLSRKKTSGIESLGYEQPSLEKIAALEPDLIVGWDVWVEGTYEELSRIAPTVGARSSYDWKRNSRVVADALNKREEIEAIISDYAARARRLEESLSALPEPPEVSVVKPREDVLLVFTNRFYAGIILEEVGVRMPESQVVDAPRKISLQLSLEQVPEIEADAIFLAVGGGGEDERAARDSFRRFTESPLWKRLRAVRNGRVYEVDPNAWFITAGPQAANLILDDLERHLLGRQT